jgi:uncharacterized protein YecT (DUF1311 family)
MRMFRLVMVILVAVLAAATIPAAHAEEGEAPDPCANSPDETALRSCRQTEFDKATSDLAAVTAELSQSLAEGYPEQADALATAQKDWQRFMISECKLLNFESLLGSAGDVYEMDCQTQMTRSRIADYKAMLDSP